MNLPDNHPLRDRAGVLLQEREAQLRRLLQAGEAAGLATPADENEVTDFKDVAAQESLAAVEDVQAAHLAAELAQVLAARRRLVQGTYGACADCGSAIAEARLLAMPAATRCGACQTLFERGLPANR